MRLLTEYLLWSLAAHAYAPSHNSNGGTTPGSMRRVSSISKYATSSVFSDRPVKSPPSNLMRSFSCRTDRVAKVDCRAFALASGDVAVMTGVDAAVEQGESKQRLLGDFISMSTSLPSRLVDCVLVSISLSSISTSLSSFKDKSGFSPM